MNSSSHIDNKGKDILILRKGPTQGLGEHLLSAEKMYSVNFTKVNTKFCLRLHYNGRNSYLFVNGTEIHKFLVSAQEMFLKIFQQVRSKKLDLMITFMISVLIIIQLMLMILKTFTNI